MITAQDVDNIYEIPLLFHREGLDDRLVETLNIWTRAPAWRSGKRWAPGIEIPEDRVEIGMVGEYVDLRSRIRTCTEALVHGDLASEVQVALTYIDSERVEREGPVALLRDLHGILGSPGLRDQGVEGKILTIRFAGSRKSPTSACASACNSR